MNDLKKKAYFWQAASLVLILLFVATNVPGIVHKGREATPDLTIVKTANAEEIYPMFSCPCCGQPLNKLDPCCGAMTQMIEYIDQKVDEGLSSEEAVLATAKEFGMDRLISESDRNVLKQKLLALAPADAPKIKMPEISQNLGSVSQKQGIISADFEFENSGKSDLVVNKLSTSCGCTSGAIVYKGTEGPRFTMEGHGQESPEDWQVAIKPGDKAVLRVYYDPSVHPDLTGAVTRTVSVISNDPVEFEKQVTITLDQRL